MITIAIDPGIWALGFAVFDQGRLVVAGCSKEGPKIRNPDLALLARRHYRQIMDALPPCRGASVALEHMETRGGDSPVRANDLIAVATVGALTAARLAAAGLEGACRLYRPRDWKGSVPKDIHHPRIRAALAPAELVIGSAAALEAGAGNAKEVWDAIGIGLFDAQRIDSAGGIRV